MNEYEESNSTISARHPKLIKDDTFEFEASKELVMCMPSDFINGLKDKKWTCIEHKLFGQVDEASEESSIKQHQNSNYLEKYGEGLCPITVVSLEWGSLCRQ